MCRNSKKHLKAGFRFSGCFCHCQTNAFCLPLPLSNPKRIHHELPKSAQPSTRRRAAKRRRQKPDRQTRRRRGGGRAGSDAAEQENPQPAADHRLGHRPGRAGLPRLPKLAAKPQCRWRPNRPVGAAAGAKRFRAAGRTGAKCRPSDSENHDCRRRGRRPD